MKHVALAVASIALALTAKRAAADLTVQQCIDTSTSAQHSRIDGKLLKARADFRACAIATCPALVRNACTDGLAEAEQAQPTVVFSAKDASGADVANVRVTIDGAPLSDRLDGRALEVDPGSHVFVFDAEGHPSVTRTLTVTLGQKGQPEVISLSDTAAHTEAPVTTGGMSRRKVLGLVTASVGGVGLIVGGVFGGLTLSERSREVSDCSPTSCPNHGGALDAVSTGTTYGTLSTVTLIAGAALIAGGAVLFFTGRSAPATSATGWLTKGLGAAPAGALFTAKF